MKVEEIQGALNVVRLNWSIYARSVFLFLLESSNFQRAASNCPVFPQTLVSLKLYRLSPYSGSVRESFGGNNKYGVFCTQTTPKPRRLSPIPSIITRYPTLSRSRPTRSRASTSSSFCGSHRWSEAITWWLLGVRVWYFGIPASGSTQLEAIPREETAETGMHSSLIPETYFGARSRLYSGIVYSKEGTVWKPRSSLIIPTHLVRITFWLQPARNEYNDSSSTSVDVQVTVLSVSPCRLKFKRGTKQRPLEVCRSKLWLSVAELWRSHPQSFSVASRILH